MLKIAEHLFSEADLLSSITALFLDGSAVPNMVAFFLLSLLLCLQQFLGTHKYLAATNFTSTYLGNLCFVEC